MQSKSDPNLPPVSLLQQPTIEATTDEACCSCGIKQSKYRFDTIECYETAPIGNSCIDICQSQNKESVKRKGLRGDRTKTNGPCTSEQMCSRGGVQTAAHQAHKLTRARAHHTHTINHPFVFILYF